MAENVQGPYRDSSARAVAIVEYLASRPGQTFSLSEIARRCGINKSTAYKILRGLQTSGWVTRWPTDLCYGLGPTLIAIGRAASNVRPEVNLARPILDELAAEFQCEIVFTTVVSDQILILESTGRIDLRPSRFRRGDLAPLIAPMGAVFMAWQKEGVRKDWYERSGVRDENSVKQMEEVLRQTDRRGYLVTLQTDIRSQLTDLMDLVSEDLTDEQRRNLLKEHLTNISTPRYFGSSTTYLGGASPELATNWMVESLQAPVFDMEGTPRYAIGTGTIDREYDREALELAGGRIRKAADRISAALSVHGQPAAHTATL